MASSPFEVEDTDEDFFDRLVNDDIDFIEFVHKPVQKKEFVDVKAFSKLSISEVDPVGVDTSGNASLGVNGELGHEDGVVVEQSDPVRDPVVVKESESLIVDSRNKASASDDIVDNRNGASAPDDIDDNRNEPTELEDKAGNGNEAKSLEDKAGNENEANELEDKGEEGSVNGMVNTSLASVGSGVKVAQWSSFSGEFGDVSVDPFAILGNTDKLWAESNVTDIASENSVPDLGVSSYGQHQEGQHYGVVEGQILDGQDLNTSLASVGSRLKEVQWTSFNSDWNPSGDFGDFSADPFANLGNTDESWAMSNVTDGALENSVADVGISSYGQQQEGQHYGAVEEQNTDGQELNSSQNWDNLYPGWRYDPNTGQWYQLEGYDVNANASTDLNTNENAQESVNVHSQTADNVVFSDQKADAYYLQQPAQSVPQSVAQGSETSAVTDWNQHSNGSTDYPAHMVFDPQYPGWYYDTITQEWKQLESSTPAFDQSTTVEYNQQFHNSNVENHGSDVANWDGSMSTYNQQNASMWHNQTVSASDTISVTETQQYTTQYFSTGHLTSSVNQQPGFNPSGSVALSQQASHGYNFSSGVGGFEGFNPSGNLSHHQHQAKEPNQVTYFSPANFDSQKPVQFLQQPLHSGTQFSHEARAGRSSAGRPPHALVTFGFGGKLIVMKDYSNMYGSQDSVGGSINVLNLMDVVMDKTDVASFGNDGRAYFHALCQQSYPGPLVGGSVGSREVNKWIDEKIANCETPYMDIRKGDHSRLLFSLLKIACQYYGKLRSPFGTDVALKESDSPESAVAKLFASAKRSNEYSALMSQNLPSEAQSQATALEVQKLLVSGRKKEALQCAQNGQLWGPALVIASQLGEQFYGDTVKLMALNQLAAGSPLRTLCLLIARQPADVFSSATTDSSIPNSMNVSQQQTQVGANSMLDEWEENLAILTANRTKDDELVIIHLGDCLWKERGHVYVNTPAHICYLVAEANFEAYSDSARLCLIGADHLKYPRTYASPEAIQRTELYEHSRVLGNSQFLLLPFQPYKLIYAHMLAEVGKVADALKYCQAILKSLKYGRAPEVDTWRQLVSSLEERIRAHQQGGYSTNSAPTKLMGKLLTLFDNTAHRVVGGPPPPAPSISQVLAQRNEHAQQPGGPSVSSNQSTMAMPSFMPGPSLPNSQSTMAVSSFMPGPSVPYSQSTMAVSSFIPGPSVSNSQSTMTMSPLMPSASMEPISEWTAEGNQLNIPNRSISEPNFGGCPNKVDSSKKVESSKPRENESTSSGSSRFGFGIFQKTLGFVKRSRQAKLGEKNKFYYDEKLKRWVEEGVEPPAGEAALPPPPPTAAFPNRMQDYNINDALETKSFPAVNGPQIPSLVSPEPSSGIPPIPPSSNQFSAHGRTGVRSRYVDTFNKGGRVPTNLFRSPSLPSAKPGGGPKPNIFFPAPVTSYEETVQTPGESIQEPLVTNINPPKSFEGEFSTPQTSTSSSMTMQRFPSMDNIVQKRAGDMGNGNSFAPPESRRAASWSGSLNHASNPSIRSEIKPLGRPLGMSPLSQMHNSPPSSMQLPSSGGSLGDDLQEVEL